MELFVKRFDELTLDELYGIMQLRVDVFVVEQNCPYPDLDGRDKIAYHVFLKDDEGIQGYLRVIEAGKLFEETGIGRVIARKRRCGIGSQLLKAGIDTAKNVFHADKIKVEAQTYAVPFYEQAGFKCCSEEFLEDGIPHIAMILDLE